MSKNSSRSLQLIKTKEVSGDPSPVISGTLKVRNLKQAKRAMSKLIESFVRGEVCSSDAKTLAYLVSTFIEVAQAADIEQRLSELEQKLSR